MPLGVAFECSSSWLMGVVQVASFAIARSAGLASLLRDGRCALREPVFVTGAECIEDEVGGNLRQSLFGSLLGDKDDDEGDALDAREEPSELCRRVLRLCFDDLHSSSCSFASSTSCAEISYKSGAFGIAPMYASKTWRNVAVHFPMDVECLPSFTLYSGFDGSSSRLSTPGLRFNSRTSLGVSMTATRSRGGLVIVVPSEFDRAVHPAGFQHPKSACKVHRLPCGIVKRLSAACGWLVAGANLLASARTSRHVGAAASSSSRILLVVVFCTPAFAAFPFSSSSCSSGSLQVLCAGSTGCSRCLSSHRMASLACTPSDRGAFLRMSSEAMTVVV